MLLELLQSKSLLSLLPSLILPSWKKMRASMGKSLMRENPRRIKNMNPSMIAIRMNNLNSILISLRTELNQSRQIVKRISMMSKLLKKNIIMTHSKIAIRMSNLKSILKSLLLALSKFSAMNKRIYTIKTLLMKKASMTTSMTPSMTKSMTKIMPKSMTP